MNYIRESFARQKAMALIGASLTMVSAGKTEVGLPYRDDLTQQKGFVHGAIARGALVARGEVVKAGRTLTVVRAEVYAEDGKHIATMQQTLMMLPDTADTPDP